MSSPIHNPSPNAPPAPGRGAASGPASGRAAVEVSSPLLRVENLVKHFPIKGGLLSRTDAKVNGDFLTKVAIDPTAIGLSLGWSF